MNKPIQYASPRQQKISEFLLAEYNNLRNEILKRTEIQHQLISMALVAIGTFLAIKPGDTTAATTAMLAYPILALFISMAWSQNDIRIGQLGRYIKEQVEERFGKAGWENYHAPLPDLGKIGSLAHFASRGVLVGTQLLAVLVSLTKGLPNLKDHPLDVILLYLDGLAIIITVILLSQRWKNSLSKILQCKS